MHGTVSKCLCCQIAESRAAVKQDEVFCSELIQKHQPDDEIAFLVNFFQKLLRLQNCYNTRNM